LLVRVSVEMKKPPNTDRIGGEVGDVGPNTQGAVWHADWLRDHRYPTTSAPPPLCLIFACGNLNGVVTLAPRREARESALTKKSLAGCSS
jgi:hypothetical protein